MLTCTVGIHLNLTGEITKYGREIFAVMLYLLELRRMLYLLEVRRMLELRRMLHKIQHLSFRVSFF